MENILKTVGIIGYGEVGKAIETLAKEKYEVYCRDLNFDQIKTNKIDILNLCFPYSQKFVPVALEAIAELNPSLVIIHSTVKPGTTRTLFKESGVLSAHTPIMGVHPHLAEYQSTFTKIIGAVNEEAFNQTKEFWTRLGAKEIARFDGPEESEMGKIVCTTYYGWNIIFNKAIKQMTDQKKLNFDQVYHQINQIYNAGYAKTLPHVIRPDLKHMDGPIGGHCVLPNATFMQDEGEVFSEFLKLVKKFS